MNNKQSILNYILKALDSLKDQVEDLKVMDGFAVDDKDLEKAINHLIKAEILLENLEGGETNGKEQKSYDD